jgi:hypothetical protein
VRLTPNDISRLFTTRPSTCHTFPSATVKSPGHADATAPISSSGEVAAMTGAPADTPCTPSSAVEPVEDVPRRALSAARYKRKDPKSATTPDVPLDSSTPKPPIISDALAAWVGLQRGPTSTPGSSRTTRTRVGIVRRPPPPPPRSAAPENIPSREGCPDDSSDDQADDRARHGSDRADADLQDSEDGEVGCDEDYANPDEDYGEEYSEDWDEGYEEDPTYVDTEDIMARTRAFRERR